MHCDGVLHMCACVCVAHGMREECIRLLQQRIAFDNYNKPARLCAVRKNIASGKRNNIIRICVA